MLLIRLMGASMVLVSTGTAIGRSPHSDKSLSVPMPNSSVNDDIVHN